MYTIILGFPAIWNNLSNSLAPQFQPSNRTIWPSSWPLMTDAKYQHRCSKGTSSSAPSSPPSFSFKCEPIFSQSSKLQEYFDYRFLLRVVFPLNGAPKIIQENYWEFYKWSQRIYSGDLFYGFYESLKELFERIYLIFFNRVKAIFYGYLLCSWIIFL